MKKIIVVLLACLLPHAHTATTPPQQAPSQQNYRNCINGYSSCNASQLDAPERARVQEAAHQRNYNSCLRGYSSCDPSKLDADEKPLVQKAAHQRNYSSCIHGYSSCDPSKLEADEKPLVQKAAHQRNYNSCLHGYSNCDKSKLYETEITSVDQAQSPNVTADSQQAPTATPKTTPHYYTNKDGIRVQSPTHYDSPPSGATAQCGDGSYSFSLNHRGTCSHHGGVSKWLD
jgi:Protein of unknown function (DUF3761)